MRAGRVGRGTAMQLTLNPAHLPRNAKPKDEGNPMNYITKSLPAMILLSAAAMLLTLGEAFNVAAYASLTPTSLGVANDLSHAGDWLTFAAIAIGLLALGTAAWATVLAKNWAAVAEIGVGMD